MLLQVMQTELTRAMGSLGSTVTPAAPVDAKAKNQPQPKPYFISYAVADTDNISMSAQFGALTGDNESRRPHRRRTSPARKPGRG